MSIKVKLVHILCINSESKTGIIKLEPILGGGWNKQQIYGHVEGFPLMVHEVSVGTKWYNDPW